MIFTLGKSLEEEFSAKRQSKQWHKWFAWYPADINFNTFAWLQIVERRALYVGGSFLGWDYRLEDK
jgi:hypothetical protein